MIFHDLARRVTYLFVCVSASYHAYYIAKEGPRHPRAAGYWFGLFACLCAFTLLLSGCRHTTPALPPLPATPAAATVGLVGQNEGFHGPILPDIVDHDCARSAAPFQYRSPQLSVDGAQQLLASVQRCDHVVLNLLIEQDNRPLAAALGAWAVAHPDRVVDIECGNELDITAIDRGQGSPTTLDAEQHATWVYDCVTALRTAGYGMGIISGAVYTLDDASWTYLQPTIKVCHVLGCKVGLHDYDNFDPTWMDRLAQAGVAWVISETGAPSATPAQDTGQAAFLEEACTGAARAHVAGWTVYQGPSGPGTTNLDHFGTRYFTLPGQPLQYKPADTILTGITHGTC